MKHKLHQKIIAVGLSLTMLFSNASVSLPVFAAGTDSESYPASTSNKDNVITVDKSVAWDGADAHAANYKATIKLKASGIEKAVELLPVTNAADISFVLDKSGSMAACLVPTHNITNYTLFRAESLKDKNQEKAKAALSGVTLPVDLTTCFIKVDGLCTADYNIYMTPVKTTVTKSSLNGWAVFGINPKDGSRVNIYTMYSLMKENFTTMLNGTAPYFLGHFRMSGYTPVQHIVAEHGTDYYLAEPVQQNSGWFTTTSEKGITIDPSVNFRNVTGLVDAQKDFGCQYLYDVVRDGAITFINNTIDAFNDGTLAADSSISVIPFSGIIDTANTIPLTTLDTKNLKRYIIERLLCYGDFPEIRWLQSQYTSADFEEVARKSRDLIHVVANFLRQQLNLEKEDMQEKSWETDSPWHGDSLTLSTGEFPNAENESFLSQILQTGVPEKYYLSQNACLGILRRASARGKKLPELLQKALERQARSA